MLLRSERSTSFRGAARGSLMVVVSLGFVACGGNDNGGDAGTPANGHITNATNYKVVSSLAIPKITVKAQSDLQVCWKDLSTDLLKHPITTADISHVSFGQIKGVTEAEIEKQFAAGSFDDSRLSNYLDFLLTDTTTTCANLTQFKFGGKVFSPADDFQVLSGYAYMLMWAEGLNPGVGVKTMCFLEPDPTSDVVTVNAPQGKDILTFQADLQTPQKLDIPAAGPWVVEWSGLTKDAMEQPVDYAKLDTILVAHYNMAVSELEARALDFDLIADTKYTAKIPEGKKQIDLATAKTDAGAAFAGFTSTTGFWGIAILCGDCQIPAPVSVSVVNPT